MGLKGEGYVFGLLHPGSFLWGLVVEAAEVQQAVYDDAAKFLLLFGTILLCIGADGIEADVDVAAQGIALRVVKADMVGIVVMTYEAAVDVEDGFIIHKDVVHVAHHLAIALCHLPDPSRDLCLADVGHRRVLSVEGNHYFWLFLLFFVLF